MKELWRGSDDAQRLGIANAGEGPLQAVVTVNGAPLTPEPAADRGFKIERSYHALDGEKVDIAKVKQNQRFVVVLKATDAQINDAINQMQDLVTQSNAEIVGRPRFFCRDPFGNLVELTTIEA